MRRMKKVEKVRIRIGCVISAEGIFNIFCDLALESDLGILYNSTRCLQIVYLRSSPETNMNHLSLFRNVYILLKIHLY